MIVEIRVIEWERDNHRHAGNEVVHTQFDNTVCHDPGQHVVHWEHHVDVFRTWLFMLQAGLLLAHG